MKNLSGVCIILAGCFWGVMGVFVRTFTAMGFSAMQISALRLGTAAVVMLLTMVLWKPTLLRIKGRDIPLLALTGVLSIGGMSALYFATIRHSTLSVAAVLLYLSPVAVTLMSTAFLKEKFTLKKVLAMALAVVGCALVSGIMGGGSVSPVALLTGIGSAVTYGSYSILGTKAMERNHPFTVTAYAFAAAGIVLMICCQPAKLVATAMVQPDLWMLAALILALGLCTAVIPFALYTLGLHYTVPSKAAVLACSEPVAATLFGLAVYNEQPDFFAYGGIVLVLGAILLLSGKKKLAREE